MIFYFTGTGNSWYAAKSLCQESEELINIAECMKKERFSFDVPKGEKIGFVFPVYFGGIPSIVREFAEKLSLGTSNYTYAVMTCGSFTGAAAGQLHKVLKAGGNALHAAFKLVMPDNYALMYSTEEEEKCLQIIGKADEELKKIAEQVEACVSGVGMSGTTAKLAAAVMYPLYDKTRKTDKFYADDSCVGCGVFASRCPVGAIQMQDGKPTWVKERCTLCMACARCNAIQYGNKMKKHKRYVNPEYKKVTSCH